MSPNCLFVAEQVAEKVFRAVILSRFAPLRIALSPSVVILSEAKNLRAGSAKRLTVNSAKNLPFKRINDLRDPSSPSASQDNTHWAFFRNLPRHRKRESRVRLNSRRGRTHPRGPVVGSRGFLLRRCAEDRGCAVCVWLGWRCNLVPAPVSRPQDPRWR